MTDGRWLWSGGTEPLHSRRGKRISSDRSACYSAGYFRILKEVLAVRLKRTKVVTRECFSRPFMGREIFLFLYRKYCVVIKLKSTDSYRAKKRSAVDRTAAEWNHVAHATRRRRRILPWQDSFYRGTICLKI